MAERDSPRPTPPCLALANPRVPRRDPLGSLAVGGDETKADEKPKDPKAIWDEDEVADRDDVEDASDPRPRPKYDIVYKQNVTSEDMFLGMSDVDPSSNSCNFVVLKIKFPGDKLKDIDLDVTQTRIVAQSPTHRLSTYLPHPVKHKDGNAKWDAKRETLIVTLPIIREDW